jgi:tRNA (mo5U34)-methyltransferase
MHSIALAEGVVSPGAKTPGALAAELQSLQLPPLHGKTVLDIGAWDGFYSFAAEEHGAARVVALDYHAWASDKQLFGDHVRAARAQGVPALPMDQAPGWDAVRLPGRSGFDLARRVKQSRVEPIVGDFMTLGPAEVGAFDVVLFLGVLYHIEDPLRALRRVAALTKEVAILETLAGVVPGYEHTEICEFFSDDRQNGDPTNWWAPNLKALVGMCRAAGFTKVDVLVGPPAPRGFLGGRARALAKAVLASLGLRASQPYYYRAVVHARK